MSVSDMVGQVTQPTTYTAASVAVVSSLEHTPNEMPWVAIISIGVAVVSLGINWYYKHKDSQALHRERGRP